MSPRGEAHYGFPSFRRHQTADAHECSPKRVGWSALGIGRKALIGGIFLIFGAGCLPAETLPLPGGNLPRRGALGFLVRFPKAILPNPNRSDAEIARQGVSIVKTPLFSVSVSPERDSVVLRPELQRRPPAKPLGGMTGKLGSELSRLEADRWYHLAFLWDVDANIFKIYLNGTEQESLSNAEISFWQNGAPDLAGEALLGGPDSGLEIRDARISSSPKPLEDFSDSIAQAPPLRGEGRSPASGELDLTGYRKTLLYENAFVQPLDLVSESELFAGARRVREPGPDQWVLEGNGRTFVRDGSLVMETNDFQPPPHWDGEKIVSTPCAHLVLWLNRRFPDGLLVEYSMEPHDSRRGLHILFFSATSPGGGSIFQEKLKKRDGVFVNYVRNPDELVSYHISFWGSPYTWRGTSHLRKNNHFTMLAVGDDRITHRGERPYPIRVLKDGGTIRAEVDGGVVIDFQDDGKRSGPIYRDGYLGFRMMGDARFIKLRDLKIWKLEAVKK